VLKLLSIEESLSVKKDKSSGLSRRVGACESIPFAENNKSKCGEGTKNLGYQNLLRYSGYTSSVVGSLWAESRQG
jgi:hypothetical protein